MMTNPKGLALIAGLSAMIALVAYHATAADDDRDGPPPRGPRGEAPPHFGPGGPHDGPPHMHHPFDPHTHQMFAPNLLLRVLDKDRDGKLSADELNEAKTQLQKLDFNGDGEVTHDEFAPFPPPMMGMHPPFMGRPHHDDDDDDDHHGHRGHHGDGHHGDAHHDGHGDRVHHGPQGDMGRHEGRHEGPPPPRDREHGRRGGPEGRPPHGGDRPPADKPSKPEKPADEKSADEKPGDQKAAEEKPVEEAQST